MLVCTLHLAHTAQDFIPAEESGFTGTNPRLAAPLKPDGRTQTAQQITFASFCHIEISYTTSLTGGQSRY